MPKSTNSLNRHARVERFSLVLLIMLLSLSQGSTAAESADLKLVPGPSLSTDDIARKSKTAATEEVALKADTSATKIGKFLRGALRRSSVSGKPMANPMINTKREQDSTLLQVYIELADTDDFAVQELRNLGLRLELVNHQQRKVQGWIEVSQMEGFTELENVVKITTPKFARPMAGSTTTEGDAILKANELRALGFTGKGIKIGIVSDGANNWTTARDSGDLPNQLTRYGSCTTRTADPQNCRFAKACNEGTAMAEIIHDIAPDAELAVASANTSLEFIQQINRLADEFRADIIVDDLGFFGEPWFEDGPIAQAVADLPSRVLYISSAGNSADSHYEDTFRPTVSNVLPELQNLSLHDFEASASVDDPLHGFVIGPDRGAFVLLQWRDEQSPYAATTSDYDLSVFAQNGVLVGRSNFNNLQDEAIEGTCIYNGAQQDEVFFAAVDFFGGPEAEQKIKLFLLGTRAIEYPIARGSIFGHAATERAIAVGTINASEPGNDSIAFYSSQGPTDIASYDPAEFLHDIETRLKPDLVGIDGVSVTGAGGFPSQFFGTSAAAPHIAGLAAQLMSVSPMVSATNARKALIEGAVDLGPQGRDDIYGFGRADVLAAFQALKYGRPIPAIILLLDED